MWGPLGSSGGLLWISKHLSPSRERSDIWRFIFIHTSLRNRNNGCPTMCVHVTDSSIGKWNDGILAKFPGATQDIFIKTMEVQPRLHTVYPIRCRIEAFLFRMS